MLEHGFNDLAWREVHWQRLFTLETVREMLVHLAGIGMRGAIVWEARGNRSGVRYLLGTEKESARKVCEAMQSHGDIQFREASERRTCAAAAQLKISKPVLALRTDCEAAAIRAALAAMQQAGKGDGLVLQIVLGRAFTPAPMPQKLPDPHATWLDHALGSVGIASPESRAAVKEKITHHGFDCAVRLGGNTQAGIASLLSALRVLESAGVRLTAKPEDQVRLNEAHICWHFPMRLSVKELSHFLLLPAGEEELPGVPGLHPKLLLPPSWYRKPIQSQDRTFAVSLDGQKNLSISPRDCLEHAIVTGPTGAGKSTILINLALADFKAGRSVLILDPKFDLINDLLARFPESRDEDVVVIDPSSPNPVGFNPLAFHARGNPTLVADAVLAVFQAVFSENWGIRSQDVLSAALLTLAQCEGATLLWLPALLTDEGFRQKVTAGIRDKVGLAPFWESFEAMKDSERRQEIAPVLNKVRQFLLRPGLRNVLGQSRPKFSLTDLFHKRRIVLVPLNKGMIGSESAKLLGSLIVGLTWTLALERASLPQERRHLVNVYIDELQDYLNLPTDLSDALAQARGLGVGLTLAHQYREQLPPDIRAGIDANARNKIVFGLNAADAKAYAGMAPELEPVDFMTLPRYQVYASFQAGGKNTGWVSGRTLPPPQATRSAAEVYAKSMAAYGRPAAEVEAEYLWQLGYETDAQGQETAPDAPVGRRKKGQDDA